MPRAPANDPPLKDHPSRLAEAPTSVAVGLREVPLIVRESLKARRLALRIDAAGEAVELVLPRRVSLATGLRFLGTQRAWIAARIAVLPQHVAFADGALVPILGAPHRIRHLGARPAASARVIACEEGEIRVYAEPAHLARRVRDHLIALARAELTRRARVLAGQVDRRIQRITVRDTKSRWGSCSATGALSFSWRLILAPEPVLDYVVAHEVAHLVEMNHGPRFWRLVEALAPGATRQRDWLQRHRARLLRYG